MKASRKLNIMYKFVKIQDKSLPKLDYDYMLYCTSFEQMLEHSEKYMGMHIKEGLEDYFQNRKYHATTMWRSQIETLAEIKGTTVLNAATYLENKIFQGKLSTMNKFGNILLRENGSYTIFSDSYIILDEIINEKMIYPTGDYSIRVIKWNNGTHFYAKVGKFDVVDKYGNQKWHSRTKATEKAEEFKINLLSNGNK